MGAGPCLCGSLDCNSCGPAQGSRRCALHGRYACSSCEEYREEHGSYPEPDPPDPDDDDDLVIGGMDHYGSL